MDTAQGQLVLEPEKSTISSKEEEATATARTTTPPPQQDEHQQDCNDDSDSGRICINSRKRKNEILGKQEEAQDLVQDDDDDDDEMVRNNNRSRQGRRKTGHNDGNNNSNNNSQATTLPRLTPVNEILDCILQSSNTAWDADSILMGFHETTTTTTKNKDKSSPVTAAVPPVEMTVAAYLQKEQQDDEKKSNDMKGEGETEETAEDTNAAVARAAAAPTCPPPQSVLYFRRQPPPSSSNSGNSTPAVVTAQDILWDKHGRVDCFLQSGNGSDSTRVSAQTLLQATRAAAAAAASGNTTSTSNNPSTQPTHPLPVSSQTPPPQQQNKQKPKHQRKRKGKNKDTTNQSIDQKTAPSAKSDDDEASASSGASLSVPQNQQQPVEAQNIEDEKNSPRQEQHPPPPRSIHSLRLEAIFHPKFENEKVKGGGSSVNQQQQQQADDSTRQVMKQRVQDGHGYLEVSLKHSGSLLLWSGGQRYYSKNATNNIFTHVGEVLLRQHFVRAHWNKNNSNSNINISSIGQNTVECMYQECSDYVEQHRLTLAFEVVTAVLGDHGDIPRRDFLILTAIASRAEERFYATPELLACAQRFGLPHNDAWVFSTPHSVDALFCFYDAQRETAFAETVISALNEMAETHVESMYPHVDFQGDILEGIVIRYVRNHKTSSSNSGGGGMGNDDNDDVLSQMKRLSKASKVLAACTPPSLADCFTLTTALVKQGSQNNDIAFPLLLTTNVRAIFQETRLNKETGPQSFAGRIFEVLNQSSSSSGRREDDRRTTKRFNNPSSKKLESVDICKLAKDFLAAAAATTTTTAASTTQVDPETVRIASLICTLVRLRCRVEYSIVCEQMNHCQNGNDGDASKKTTRWLCIIHVLHDAAFQKFRRSMTVGDMALFRGFVVEINGMDRSSDSLNVNRQLQDMMALDNDGATAAATTIAVDDDDLDGGSLMLKMKFLPYMVRTFGCRNGMSTLRRDGKEAFLKYVSNILSKWKMSTRAKQTWMPFFAAWADYAEPRMGKKLVSESEIPSLTENVYLTHLERFRVLYESGQLKPHNDGTNGSDNKVESAASTFQGLLVVVAVERETSDRVGDWFAKNLGGASRNRNLNEITSDRMDAFCTKGSGVVCSATVEDGMRNLRRLIKEHEEQISLLFFGLSDEEVTTTFTGVEQGKERKLRTLGIIKGWRKITSGCVVELPCSSLFREGPDLKPTSEVHDALSKFEKVSNAVSVDDGAKPLGLLVFFPAIPGSGKSSLSCPDMEEKVRTVLATTASKRQLIVRMGDETKIKYWPLVREERLKDTTGVYIADKNLPLTTWEIVAKICSDTSTVAVPVVPDSMALQTTCISGHRKPGGQIKESETHVYPFSLQYLALCMMRVSSRPQGTHPGKLDGSTKLACMIVVKFFTLYRRMAAEEFVDRMESSFSRCGAIISSAPIEVPFFAKSCLTALPKDLEDLLIEALQAQRGYDIAKVKRDDDQYIDDLEGRLRHSLKRHRDLLTAMTADIATSQARFTSQLMERVSEVDTGSYSVVEYDAPSAFIKLVAVDVPVSDVHVLLRDMAKDSRLAPLMKQLSVETTNHTMLPSVDWNDSQFIPKTHVTMAHFKEASQCAMRASFGKLVGEVVEVSVTAVLWDKKVAALEVRLPAMTANGNDLPKSKNEFSHVTVWCEMGTKAVASNELPGLVEKGEAQRVSLDQPVVLPGTVALWTL